MPQTEVTLKLTIIAAGNKFTKVLPDVVQQ
jgi:hypothetical protein